MIRNSHGFKCSYDDIPCSEHCHRYINPNFHLLDTAIETRVFLIILMSLVGTIGQWCMIQAFRSGEATAVAPAGCTRRIFATIIGYIFFGELPETLSLIGIVIIVCSNLILIFHEGRQ